nr:two-component regulator propeller domain-containing protein [uncultured Carboxylicivirga sp.]
MQSAKICLLLLLITIHTSILSQKKRLFDFNEGLSNSLINEVYQDHLGFIWVATEDGLNRFDGITFKSFEGSKNQPQSLKANFVTSLYEDDKGNLWVGQINGLQVYRPETELFEEIIIHINDQQIHPYVSGIAESENGDIWITTSRYGLIKIEHETGRPRYSTRLNKQLCSFYLECIFIDKDGLIWIGSDNNGLNTYNPETGEIQTFSENKSAPFYLPGNDITDICEDNKGNIYIAGLKAGLLRYSKNSHTITRIKSYNQNKKSFPVKSLLFDSKKRLWVGTDGKGLYRLNNETDLLEPMNPGSSSFDFSRSKIHSVIEDNVGNIWLGVFQKGLFLFPESPELFNHYGYRAFGENSLGSNCITAIDGSDNNLWIGTDGDGIYKLNRTTKSVNHVDLTNTKGAISGNNVLSLFHTNNQFLWIGTFFDGLIKYDTQTGKIKTFKNNPDDPSSLVNDKVTSIKPGENGELWLATLGGGICRFNPQNESFAKGINWNDSLNQLIPQWVNDIYIDNINNLWIGTYDGLVYAQRDKNRITLFTTTENFLPHNVVYSIFPDSEGYIWAGTYGGLAKINRETLTSEIFTTNDGLGSNVICGISEDERNQIWISTHNGLSRFNPEDTTFTTYYASDGLQANEFSRNAIYRSENKQLFFGGINGVTELKKDYYTYNRTIRDVMLTEFRRFNKPVAIGEKSGKHIILNESIVLADTIQLTERDNVFSIGFTSVELANQSRITYEYKMDGFDTNWNRSNSLSRSATYTNLKHGTYHFYVRGVDKEQYSTPRKLTIIIYPPWYKTSWAMALWIALAFLFMYGIMMFNKEKVLRLEAERTNENKMQFFINISHEIKTPLTLIIDPLDKLLKKKANDETMRLYQTMHLNANRIFRLVSQLLDVRKIDKGQLLVKFQKTNLYEIIMEIARSYELMAENKGIEFNVISEHKELEVWIDPWNFEKVILNLLSNAFKYTPSGGVVEIFIDPIPNPQHPDQFSAVEIKVSDTGIGLKKSDLEKIFNRFYQASSKENIHNTGTGIGLHLSRSLVELHKGKLYAENKTNGNGTNFVVVLPLGNNHLPKKDLLHEENFIPAPSNIIPIDEEKTSNNGNHSHQPSTNYNILVVEDEDEIRSYLNQELSSAYTVTVCENGAQALEIIKEKKPDLIISDIMMPILDGISLCKKLKGNIETSHIPIILLTALSKDEDKAEGIETGADMYLVKPFNSNFLKKTVANLLENRRKIYLQLSQKSNSHPIEEIKMKSHDEILMQKIMTVIKDNISESDLNVEMLADAVGISRVHMHRKLKELTNQSARDFIKNIRMKQAAYILANKKLNISEVAYAVGYSNLSHFSNSFKSFYGVSPKEYVKQNATENYA